MSTACPTAISTIAMIRTNNAIMKPMLQRLYLGYYPRHEQSRLFKVCAERGNQRFRRRLCCEMHRYDWLRAAHAIEERRGGAPQSPVMKEFYRGRILKIADDFQEVALEETGFVLADSANVATLYGTMRAKDAKVGDRVVIKLCVSAEDPWPQWRAVPEAPPAHSRDKV